MKKLLFTLVAILIGLNAQAIDYYLIGGFNGWTLGQASCKFTDKGDGTYVLDYNGTLTSGFKINDGTWDNDKANFGGSATLNPGVTYNLTDKGGNIPLSGNIINPHIVLNPTAKTLLITGQEKDAEHIYGIHSGWLDNNSWSTTDMTEQNGKWVLSNVTVPAGSFGIMEMDKDTRSQTSWISADGSGVVVLDTPMACKVEGNDFSNAAGTYTFTFDPEAMTLTVTGKQTGEDVGPDYSSWYVNIVGPYNDWNDNGVNPVDGISTTENLGIGTSGFKVKVWNGSDIYYISDGAAIPTGEWVQLYEDTFDGDLIQIAGATEESVYTVKYNVVTNQIYVTTGGSEITPGGYPENVYLIGSFPDNAWVPENAVAMTNEGNGIYSINEIDIDYGGDGASMGYFALITVKSSDWNVVNANRFGPAVKDTEAIVGENAVDGKGDLSWSIVPGTYSMTFNYDEKTLLIGKPSVEPAGDYLYMMVGKDFLTMPEPADDDQYLTYNETENAYTGELLLTRGNSFRFYQKPTDANGELKILAPYSAYELVNFNTFETYEGSGEWGAPGKWYMTALKDAPVISVIMTVDPEAGTVVFTPIEPEEVVPAALYIWGSTDGGYNYSVAGTMESNAANPAYFEITMDVPECGPFTYDDPEFGPGENEPETGYRFYLSTDGESKSGGVIYNAPLDNRIIDIEAGQKFSSTFVKTIGGTVICVNYGKMTFGFDFETKEFTAVLLKGSSVENLATEDTGVVVYNLQGIKVAESDNAEVLNTLPKGIYIVNGKKVRL